MMMISTRKPMAELEQHIAEEMKEKDSNLHVITNASGCGKTCSILDSLRKHYGIYFEVPDTIRGPTQSGLDLQKFIASIDDVKAFLLRGLDNQDRYSREEVIVEHQLRLLLATRMLVLSIVGRLLLIVE